VLLEIHTFGHRKTLVNLQSTSHQNARHAHLLPRRQPQRPGKPYGQKKDDDIRRHVQARAYQIGVALNTRSGDGAVPVSRGRAAVIRPCKGLWKGVTHGHEHGEVGGELKGPAGGEAEIELQDGNLDEEGREVVCE